MNRGLLRLLQNLALAAVSLVLVFGALEVFFRVRAVAADRSGRIEDLEARAGERGQLETIYEQTGRSGRIPLATRVRPSANRRIIYELVPNLRVIADTGQVYTTNELGFRGPPTTVAKPPGVRRILGLGDSVMYGTGVSDDETFLALLPGLLRQRYPDESWEVINTGVPGYNTAMEVEVLAARGLALEPDLVVMMFVGNDYGLPNFIRQPVDPWALESFAWRALGERLRLVAPEALIRAPRSERGDWFERDPAKVPPQYRDMVGVEGYRAAMARLDALAEEHGFEVIVVQKYHDERVAAVTAELGIAHHSFQDAIYGYMGEHGIERWNGSVLSVSARDPHPSAVGHALYARDLLAYLEDSGALARARLRFEELESFD